MGDPSAPVKGEAREAPDLMIGRIIDGRYRIDSLVAIGGMGRVYKAEQTGLGRAVAIKVLAVNPAREIHDPLFRERFALEAAMASRLTSPNTITIFEYGQTDDDIYYIVMEYVEGITLGRLIKRGGRMPIGRVVSIASQVCLSLREAHARGIVHRDIKPSNIMLLNGDHDQVKVLDFGIARQIIREPEESDLELTSSRSYIGTPEYMAPEYFDGKIDGRSDIYSVGVMLYVAVSGRLPFKGKTATQTILMALHDPAPAIDPGLGVPRALEDLILACLEKDPDHRPSSIDDVLHALQLCLSDPDAGYEVQVSMEDPADEPPLEDPFTGPSSAAIAAAAIAPAAAPRRSTASRVLRSLVAGVALLSIGFAAATVVRMTQRRGTVEPAIAPVERAPAPIAAAPAPTVAPLVTAAPTVVAPTVVAPGASEPPGVGAAETADTGRRVTRRSERARSGKAARAGARAAARAKGARDDAAPRKPKSRDPIPEGYKDSPY